VYEINSKIFFLAEVLILRGVLVLDKYIFSWQMYFIFGVVLDQGRLAFR